MNEVYTHENYYNDQGEEIPSVTTVINILKKKNILTWSNILGFKRIMYKNFINDRALLGSLIHDHINHFLNHKEFDSGNMPGVPMYLSLQEKLRFGLFCKWYEEAEIKPIWTEKRLHNQKYGGTLDLLAEVPSGLYCLIDFKTSKKIHSSHFLQLAGYLNLIEENYPETYGKIGMCQIITFTAERVIIKTKQRKEMKRYQKCFDKLYEIYNAWDMILREEWNDTLKDYKE